MIFLKNICIVLLLALAGTSQLNAMKPEEKTLIAKLEKPGASDFQIYQLLSEAIKNNPQLYLPDDITKVIVLTACELTKKLHTECYEKYGACLSNPGAVFCFITRSFDRSISHMTIIAILKACLSHSGKSLDQIQYHEDRTVLHCLSMVEHSFRLDCLKILLFVAGDKAWGLIKMQDYIGYTALHLNACSSAVLVNELLSVAPSSEELWKLICTETDNGDTVLYQLLGRPFEPDMVKKILTSAPSAEEAWQLINIRNCDRKTVLDLAIDQDEAVREILESYRPK